MIRKIGLVIIMLFLSVNVYAQEPKEEKIFMMNSKSCGYCVKFLNEFYHKWDKFQIWSMSHEYENIPKIKIPNIIVFTLPPEGKLPEWYIKAKEEKRIPYVLGTPTFFYWNGNEVVSTVVGYTSPEIFSKSIFNAVAKYKLKEKE